MYLVKTLVKERSFCYAYILCLSSDIYFISSSGKSIYTFFFLPNPLFLMNLDQVKWHYFNLNLHFKGLNLIATVHIYPCSEVQNLAYSKYCFNSLFYQKFGSNY